MVDIMESLLTSLYNTLTADDDLKACMGGSVRLSPIWAPPDCGFPYLVHRIDMANVADWSPVRACTYYLDIWSDSPSAEEVLDIRQRLMALLDNHEFSTDETTEAWLWIQTDGFIPEVEQDIWHYACQFNLGWLRDAQIGLVLKR